MLPNASRILAGSIVVALVASRAQQVLPAVPEWQIAAGGKMAFEVASVKPGEFRPPNFPLDNGGSFINMRTGELPRGRFSAGFPLSVYITFAYKIRPTPEQQRAMLARLPKWVTTDNFDIEARAPMNDATKDQMRLMVQSLLAERFHLAAHFETQTVPVLMLVLAKPVKVGPNLLPHEKGLPCDSPAANGKGDKEGPFPPACEVYAMIRQQNGMSRLGSRNTTIDLLAGAIQGQVGRPVVDRTGLSGRFDFKLEWAPELNAAAPSGPTPPADSQLTGPTFLEALDDQLGLKLESAKAPVPVLVIDHVERPSEN